MIRRSPETPLAAVIETYRAANTSAVRVSLLNVLSAVGNSAALEVVRQALQDPAAGRPARRAQCAGELAHARSPRRPAGPGTLHRRRYTPGAGASRATRAALAVGAHVPLCPPGVEHAIKVLTLTTRHGWSLALNTCAVEHARVTGRQRVSGCYFSAACVTLMLAACFIFPVS